MGQSNKQRFEKLDEIFTEPDEYKAGDYLRASAKAVHVLIEICKEQDKKIQRLEEQVKLLSCF